MLRYKINILPELKKAGYSSARLRNEKVMVKHDSEVAYRKYCD